MPDLEPITRDEKLWSGEDLEPKTRREMYIKHLYDETQVIPDKPITREEIFILKAGEELHDVTIEQLNVTENGTYSEAGVAYSPVIVNVPQTTLTTLDVTENGTYTAPSGTAYDEVDVNVPLPENAYLLKDIPNTPTTIATFSDGANLPMPKLKVGIEPVQSGSGDPSPTNICPISGWSAVDVTRTGKNLWNNNWSAYTQPSDYRICPIKLENGQYTASVKLKEGGTRQSGFTLGIAKQGDRYSNFGSFYTASTGADKTGTITVDDTWTSPKLIIYCNNETAFNDIFSNYEIQFEEGSTATTYEPYNGHTYTIDLDGTRYGGKVDLVSGVLTVDRVGIKGVNVVRVGQTGSGVRYADTTHIYADLVQNTTTISDRYVQINTSQSGESGKFRAYDGEFTIYDDRFTDTTTAQSLLNDVEFCYELATPTTIQLSPTQVNSLLGVNNVWADCGDIIDGQYFSKEV